MQCTHALLASHSYDASVGGHRAQEKMQQLVRIT